MITKEAFFKNKVVAVTGGLGSIGSEIVRQVQEYDIKQLIVIDNRETELFYAKSQYNTNQSYDERIIFEFVDVRDAVKLKSVLKGVDVVFHAAAMKHVIICEENPYDAIQTNVDGTRNVIDACVENNVGKMVFISTDKAVNPSSVMGATKLLGEKLVAAMFNSARSATTEFGIVRFGNVLSSRGSVIEIWDRQIQRGEPITITDDAMTRFFMSIPQAVDLIFDAALATTRGETCILKMPSVTIEALAKVYLRMKGKDESYPMKVIGKRKGEKQHEELLLEGGQNNSFENEKMFVRLPEIGAEASRKELVDRGFEQTKTTEFSSADVKHLLSFDDIQKALESSYKAIAKK